MKSKANINEILSRVFRLKLEDINDTLTIAEVETWDSLSHMDLITSIEEEFNIELTMDEIVEMRDVSKIKEIVGSKSKI